MGRQELETGTWLEWGRSWTEDWDLELETGTWN